MISFVYFDIGGVVIKDFSASNKWDLFKQRDIGISREQLPTFNKMWEHYAPKLNSNLDVDELIPEFEKQFNLSFPPNFSILDQFIKRFEPNKSLQSIIQSIHQNCRVGLLTNMYPRMFDKIKTANLLPQVEWDVIIDSSIEGVQKPEPKIYVLAESRANVPSKEILFVDNTQANLEIAKSQGWSTFLYDSSNYEQSSKNLSNFMKEKIR